MRRDGGRIAEDEIDHPGRKAGIEQALHDGGRRIGRLLGGLEDNRAARRERGAVFPGHEDGGEVPRREGGDDADRSRHELAPGVAGPTGQGAALDTPGLLAVPGEGLDRAAQLTGGFRQRLALGRLPVASPASEHGIPEFGQRNNWRGCRYTGISHLCANRRPGFPCRLQADFGGTERILGRDVLNRLDVLFRGPAREVVINP